MNVCYALRTSQLFNTPNMSRSAYVAHVDPKNCVACGRCVEYCPAGAVKLGQKLCRADGTGQTYPKHALPGDHFWSEKDWDWDYRDNNRKNCYDTGTAPCKTACPAHIAVDFLRKTSAGEAWPLTGDAVVIGGNVAVDVSRTAVRCGAAKVSQYCLESEKEMPASDEEVAEARADGVAVNCGWGPKEILTENGKVTGIVLKRCVSVYDADHRFSPKYDESDTVTVPCAQVFLAVGQSILFAGRAALVINAGDTKALMFG